MSKKLMDELVTRFLGWKLPADFAPDCGISFKKESDYEHPEFGRTKFEPVGTNLFTADQARQMLEHVLGSAVAAPDSYATEEEGQAFMRGFFEGYDEAMTDKSS